MTFETDVLKRLQKLEREQDKLKTWESSSGRDRPYATLVIAPYNSLAPTATSADYMCNGDADEIELMAAVNSISAGSIVLLDGDFILASPWLWDQGEYNNIEIIGQGRSTKITTASVDSSFAPVAFNLIEFSQRIVNVAFRHMHFYNEDWASADSAFYSPTGLAIQALNFEDVWIRGMGNHGVEIGLAENCFWDRLIVSESQDNGVHVTTMHNGHVNGGHFHHNGGDGFHVINSVYSRYKDLDAYNNLGRGIYIGAT